MSTSKTLYDVAASDNYHYVIIPTVKKLKDFRVYVDGLRQHNPNDILIHENSDNVTIELLQSVNKGTKIVVDYSIENSNI